MTDFGTKRVRRLIGWCISLAFALGTTLAAQSPNAVPISSGPVITPYNTPAVNAPVRVCFSSSFGTPCNTSGVTLYSDSNLTQAIGNPTSTNSQGLYSFYLNSSQYTLPQFFVMQITVTPTITYQYTFSITASSGLSVPVPISEGGTGATTQPGAFNNIVGPGGTMTGTLNAPSFGQVNGPVSVVFGDSIGAGHLWSGGQLECAAADLLVHPTPCPRVNYPNNAFDLPLAPVNSNFAGTPAYLLLQILGGTVYNTAIGGTTLANNNARACRDVLANGCSPSDSIGSTVTIPTQANIEFLITPGTNDIGGGPNSGISAAALEALIQTAINTAATNHIKLILSAIISEKTWTQAGTAWTTGDTVNQWMATACSGPYCFYPEGQPSSPTNVGGHVYSFFANYQGASPTPWNPDPNLMDYEGGVENYAHPSLGAYNSWFASVIYPQLQQSQYVPVLPHVVFSQIVNANNVCNITNGHQVCQSSTGTYGNVFSNQNGYFGFWNPATGAFDSKLQDQGDGIIGFTTFAGGFGKFNFGPVDSYDAGITQVQSIVSDGTTGQTCTVTWGTGGGTGTVPLAGLNYIKLNQAITISAGGTGYASGTVNGTLSAGGGADCHGTISTVIAASGGVITAATTAGSTQPVGTASLYTNGLSNTYAKHYTSGLIFTSANVGSFARCRLWYWSGSPVGVVWGNPCDMYLEQGGTGNGTTLWIYEGSTGGLTNWFPVLTTKTGVAGPGSSTSGNIPSFNGTGGNVLQDSGVAAANLVQISGGKTLTNTYGCLDGWDHLPCTVGKAIQTGQTSTIASFALFTPGASGHGNYSLSGYCWVTSTGTGTLTMTASWNNGTFADSSNFSTVTMSSATGRGTAVIGLYSASSQAINFATSGTITGTYSCAETLTLTAIQ